MITVPRLAVRDAAPGDRTALGRVLQEHERRVFGSAPALDEAVALVGDPAGVRLAELPDRGPVALVRRAGPGQVDVLAAPLPAESAAELLAWTARAYPAVLVAVHEGDAQLLAALPGVPSWRHHHSSEDRLRQVAAPLPELPAPEGVRVDPLPAPFEDVAALHTLLFRDAQWVRSGSGPEVSPGALAEEVAEGVAPRGAWATETGTGRPVGVVVGRREEPGVLWIGRVAVAADLRGRGLSHALLRRVALDARAEGLDWLSVAVHTDNPPALALYDRWGFETEQTFHIWQASPTGG